MKPNPKEVGARIFQIRTTNKMTGEQFGKMADNADKALISKWEKGLNIPNKKRCHIIASFAGITVGELLFGNQNDLYKYTTEELLEEIKRRLARIDT